MVVAIHVYLGLNLLSWESSYTATHVPYCIAQRLRWLSYGALHVLLSGPIAIHLGLSHTKPPHAPIMGVICIALQGSGL